MKRRHPSRGDALAIIAIALVLTACVNHGYQNAIEVKEGTTDEKLARARSIATEERLSRLKAEIKERVPGVTDVQLARMGLRWNARHFKAITGETPKPRVTVIVAIIHDKSFDPKPIIDAATGILELEVNPPESGSAATAAAPASPVDIPEMYWLLDADRKLVSHVPSQMGFPQTIGDFRLYECWNLKKPPQSFAVSYVTEKQGGVRVVVMIYHRSVLGNESAKDASKIWITEQASGIARRHHPESRPFIFSFNLRLPGRTLLAHASIEPPDSPDSDESIVWLTAAVGDYVIGSRTTFHNKSISDRNAVKIVGNMIPSLKWSSSVIQEGGR